MAEKHYRYLKEARTQKEGHVLFSDPKQELANHRDQALAKENLSDVQLMQELILRYFESIEKDLKRDMATNQPLSKEDIQEVLAKQVTFMEKLQAVYQEEKEQKSPVEKVKELVENAKERYQQHREAQKEKWKQNVQTVREAPGQLKAFVTRNVFLAAQKSLRYLQDGISQAQQHVEERIVPSENKKEQEPGVVHSESQTPKKEKEEAAYVDTRDQSFSR